MKKLLFVSIVAISLGCTKEALKDSRQIISKLKEEMTQVSQLKNKQQRNPDFLKIYDAGDGDFITPNMIIKIWYTVEDDLYTIAEAFIDETTGYNYHDLQNNPNSYFYNKTPDKTFTITEISYDTQKRIAAILKENKYVLAEIKLLPMSNEHTISHYNFLYLTYINTNLSQSFIAKCDAFRAGI